MLLFTELVVDFFDLASEIGVMFPTSFGAGVALDFVGIDILLGGLAGFSLPERSRTPTLLLTVDAGFPLKVNPSTKFSIPSQIMDPIATNAD